MNLNLNFIKKEMKTVASFLAVTLILNPAAFADSTALLQDPSLTTSPAAAIEPSKAAEKNAVENKKASAPKSEPTSEFFKGSALSWAASEDISFSTAKKDVPVSLGSLQITLRVAPSNGMHSVDISKKNPDSSLTFVKNIQLLSRPEATIQVGHYKTPEGREVLLLNYSNYYPSYDETKIVDGLTGSELPIIRGKIETAAVTDTQQLELTVKTADKPWPQEITTVDLTDFKVVNTRPINLDVTTFVPASSNSHFGFLGTGRGSNTDLWLIDFEAYAKTGELPRIIGSGSEIRHAIIKKDVSPDGKTVIVFYHESGADYLAGSGFSIQRMSDIKQGNMRHAEGKNHVHPQSISFDAVTGKAAILTQERNNRQVLNIWDPVSESLIEAELKGLSADKVLVNPAFVPSFQDLIVLTYTSGEMAYYDAKTGKKTSPSPLAKIYAQIKNELHAEKVDISKLTFTTAPAPDGLYAVTATEQAYPGKAHFFVFNDNVQKLLRYESDAWNATRSITFDDTKSAVFILRGNPYHYPDGSLYSGRLQAFLLNGSNALAHELYVSQTGVTIIDPDGVQLVVENYEATHGGSRKIILNVSAQAVSQVSVEEHYISAARLAQLPTALTNTNYALQIVRELYRSNEYYDIYNKVTGKYIMTLTKKYSPPQLGIHTELSSVPDVSQDGKHIIGLYTSFSTLGQGSAVGQTIEVYDAVTGASIKSIEIELRTVRQALSAKAIFQNGGNAVLVTYADDRTRTFDINPQYKTMASNPNFYYVERSQTGTAVIKVYDIYTKDGAKLFSIPKERFNIQGYFFKAVSVPDISPDGKNLMIGYFEESQYTGHRIQMLFVQIYDMASQRRAGSIVLLWKDNQAITADETPVEIRFVPGSSTRIRAVTKNLNRLTVVEYDIKTRKAVKRSVSTHDSEGRLTSMGITDYRADGITPSQITEVEFNPVTGKMKKWSGDFLNSVGLKIKSLIYVYYEDGTTVKEHTQSWFNTITGKPISKNVVSHDTLGRITGWVLTEYFSDGIVHNGQKIDFVVSDYRVNPETGKQINAYLSYYNKQNIRLAYSGFTYHPDGRTISRLYEVFYHAITGRKTQETYYDYTSEGIKFRKWVANFWPDGTSRSKITDTKYDPITGTELSQITTCYAMNGSPMVCAA